MNLSTIIETLVMLTAQVLSLTKSTESKMTAEEFSKLVSDEMESRDFQIDEAKKEELKVMDGE